MSLRDVWRAAPARTNRVRVFGLVVGVLAGLPVGGLAAAVAIAGLGGLTDDPTWALRLWCLVGVAALGVSLRTLLLMPSMSPRERVVGLVAAGLGVVTAAPTAFFPWPWGLAGIALVVVGVTLAWELRRQGSAP